MLDGNISVDSFFTPSAINPHTNNSHIYSPLHFNISLLCVVPMFDKHKLQVFSLIHSFMDFVRSKYTKIVDETSPYFILPPFGIGTLILAYELYSLPHICRQQKVKPTAYSKFTKQRERIEKKMIVSGAMLQTIAYGLLFEYFVYTILGDFVISLDLYSLYKYIQHFKLVIRGNM